MVLLGPWYLERRSPVTSHDKGQQNLPPGTAGTADPEPETPHLPSSSVPISLTMMYLQDNSCLTPSPVSCTKTRCRQPVPIRLKGAAAGCDLEVSLSAGAAPTGRSQILGSSSAHAPCDPVPCWETGLWLSLIPSVFCFDFAGEAVKEVISLCHVRWGSFQPTKGQGLSPWSSLLATKSQTAEISWNC